MTIIGGTVPDTTQDSELKARYGPTIAARANAAQTGREPELDSALDEFCDEWNRGTADQARFEVESPLAIGTRI